MKLQHYVFVAGEIVLVGKEPDGDSVRFRPDQPELLLEIYRSHLLRVAKDGTHQLRLEGIDAPETHFGAYAQPMGEEARKHFLLDILGFQSVEFGKAKVTSAAPEVMRAGILTASADIHGRPISYLLTDASPFGDALTGAIDAVTLKRTANYRMISDGYAYPLLYTSAPADQRAEIANAAREARAANRGIWKKDHSDRFPLADLSSIGWRVGHAPAAGTVEPTLIFPKLFRRACSYLDDKGTDLVEWLVAHDEENDRVVVNNQIEVKLSSLVRRENDRYRFDGDLCDTVFVER